MAARKGGVVGMLVGLVYDLRKEYLAAGYSEEQVAELDSEETVSEIANALGLLGHDVCRIGSARALCARLVAGERWDLVFNIAEGLHGRSREAQVPCILELYRIPYTFSDSLVCAVTLDKAITKKLVRHAGLRTPDYCVVRDPADAGNVRLRYPLFAKPIAEGTGKGIDNNSRVDSPAQLAGVCSQLLEAFHQPVLVEEFLPGREFTTGIVGTGSRARVIGTMEVAILESSYGAIYSLETKERCEELVKYSALKDHPLRTEVEELALESYLALECRDAGRVDIRLDADGKPSFMEINVLPGLHPTHSDLPMIATQEGMSYVELLDTIVRSALSRVGETRDKQTARRSASVQ